MLLLLGSLGAALAASAQPVVSPEIDGLTTLARMVSAAYCPAEHNAPQSQTTFTAPEPIPNIIASSEDEAYDELLDGAPDMSWYITSQDSTITLALSSLPTTDEVLELLSDTGFAPIPDELSPSQLSPSQPQVHGHLVHTLATHGMAALSALLSAASEEVASSWVDALDADFEDYTISTPTIQITGHGWGAAAGLVLSVLVADEIYRRSLPFLVKGTFFGLPAVGDDEFATWVERANVEFLSVVNGRDPLPLVPPPHTGFVRPKIREIKTEEYGIGESVLSDHEWFAGVNFAGQCAL